MKASSLNSTLIKGIAGLNGRLILSSEWSDLCPFEMIEVA